MTGYANIEPCTYVVLWAYEVCIVIYKVDRIENFSHLKITVKSQMTLKLYTNHSVLRNSQNLKNKQNECDWTLV